MGARRLQRQPCQTVELGQQRRDVGRRARPAGAQVAGAVDQELAMAGRVALGKKRIGVGYLGARARGGLALSRVSRALPVLVMVR